LGKCPRRSRLPGESPGRVELARGARPHRERYNAPWPEFDIAEAATDTVEIAVQVLGKLRSRVEISATATQDEMRSAAEEAAAKWIDGKTVVKAICVPGKLVNLVVK
jgi:Leucyl-tRNA synthetase